MLNYGQQRLKELGYDPENEMSYYDPCVADDTLIDHPELWADKQGNLCIGIPHLYGGLVNYDPKANTFKKGPQTTGHHKPFHIKRFAKPEEHKGNKYMPVQAGMGLFPYIPKLVRDKFAAKTKIKTLIITEGQLKAYVGGKHGIDVVGIPGINNWKKNKKSEGIFEWIADILQVCKVEKVMYLMDGDCFDVTWSEMKDLRKRPKMFIASLLSAQLYTRPFKTDIYASWIKTGHKKGLDDLLIAANEKQQKTIAREIKKVTNDCKYFEKRDIATTTKNQFWDMFHIDSHSSFYEAYKEEIGDHPFIFGNDQYILDYDLLPARVVLHKSGKAAELVFVNGVLYKKGDLMVNGNPEPGLWPVKKDSLKYKWKCTNKELDRILMQVDVFDKFVNMPGHGEMYVYSHEHTNEDGITTTYLNKYSAVNHKIKKGSTDKSFKFLKHIFGTDIIKYNEKEYERWQMGLEYLKLLWSHPTQILPILCLASEERSTGKTTFADWLKLIFQQNVREIAASDLNGNFNSFHLTALLNYIEEADINKGAYVEMLKAKSTAKRAKLNAKYEAEEEVDYHTKFILLTNKLKNFIQLDDEEVRFWILEICSIPIEERSSTFLKDLEDEIPALLYYLTEEYELQFYSEQRHWFENYLLETEALKTIKSESDYGESKVLKRQIKDNFYEFEKAVLKYSTSDIKEYIFTGEIIQHKYVSTILRDRLKMDNWKGSHGYQIYTNQYQDNSVPGVENWTVKSIDKKSNPYIFYVNDFWSYEEWTLWITDEDELLNLEKHQSAQRKKEEENKKKNNLRGIWWQDMNREQRINMKVWKNYSIDENNLSLCCKHKTFESALQAVKNKRTDKKHLDIIDLHEDDEPDF